MMKGRGPLQSFLNEACHALAGKPAYGKAIADTARLFALLEESHEPVALRLRGELEHIAIGDASVGERAFQLEAAIRAALPAIKQRFAN
jgi:hypothetical protein